MAQLSVMVAFAMLLVSAALLLLPRTCAAPDHNNQHQATLIVEYKPAAVSRAVAASGSSSSVAAAVANAAAAAAASAADRGVQDPAKRAAIAATASEAATTIPALALMTSSLAAAAAADSGVQVVAQKNYATVIQGAALTTRSSNEAAMLLRRLEQNPAVQRVWLAGTRHLVQPILHDRSPPAATVSTATASAAAPLSATSGNAVATGLAAAQRRQLVAARGAAPLICVIDTGINYKLELFGGCTGINTPRGRCRVVTGYNFVGDGYNGTQDGPQPVRGGEPLDCMGHGTMVASVAATSNGVAPGALLGSYRVFGCKGSVTDDIIIEAIDRAVTDGCDVINLSLASGSGYAEHSVYRTVMRNALRKGVLVVKAAGNSGGDGPFTADVYTAVGAITAASVGDEASGEDLDSKLVPSGFSSYGPAASLELMPHVSAPGAHLRVHTQDGYVSRASGTSFASPYVAGVLALWLQHKTAQAAAANQTLSRINQDAAMRGLVATAAPVPDELLAATFIEPVAKVGAGVIQVDALLRNQLSVSPLMLALPSALNSSYTTNVTLQWQGAPSTAGTVTYRLVHVPGAAITVSNGWYGTASAMQKVYAAARVSFKPDSVVVNTERGAKPATVQVTFSLPNSLASRPLLYSGAIRLLPAAVSGNAAADAPPPVGVPYQGFSQQWSNLRVLAAPRPQLNTDYARVLADAANALCYAPRSRPVFVNAIMDNEAPVPDVCRGGFAHSTSATLEVSLAVLKASPECSLRLTLAPEVPLHRLLVDVYDALPAVRARASRLGSLPPLDTSSGSSLAAPGKVWSFCLHWNGSYTDAATRKSRQLQPGRTYRLAARLEGPLAAADAALGARVRRTTVNISGRLAVID